MKEKLIFIISNEPWNDIKLSKHHYAIELAKNKNNFVCFINPVNKYKFHFNVKIKEDRLKNENITIIEYTQLFPYRGKFLTKLNDKIIIEKLSLLFNFNNYQKIIFWQFDSFRFIDIPKNKKTRRIYHVADSLVVTKFDVEIAKLADLIVCTNKKFIIKYNKINPNTIHIPHGVSQIFYDRNNEKIQKFKNTINPFFILIGSLNMHTNFNLLYEIAEKYKDKMLLIIGPNKTQTNISSLINKTNVTYIESMDLPELNNYIAASKIGIIPYIDENNNGRNPLKTINYISQNIPVFSSISTGIEELEGKSIFYFNNFDDFQTLVDKHNKSEYTNSFNTSYLESIKYSNLIEIILKNLL